MSVKKIVFTEAARADVRRLDKATAMRILKALHHFAATGTGDTKRLKGDTDELRLRVGDWRIRFIGERESITVKRGLHRFGSVPLAFRDEKQRVLEAGGRPARDSRRRRSRRIRYFGRSFRGTTRVLTAAAINAFVDYLRGLNEAAIMRP